MTKKKVQNKQMTPEGLSNLADLYIKYDFNTFLAKQEYMELYDDQIYGWSFVSRKFIKVLKKKVKDDKFSEVITTSFIARQYVNMLNNATTKDNVRVMVIKQLGDLLDLNKEMKSDLVNKATLTIERV